MGGCLGGRRVGRKRGLGDDRRWRGPPGAGNAADVGGGGVKVGGVGAAGSAGTGGDAAGGGGGAGGRSEARRSATTGPDELSQSRKSPHDAQKGAPASFSAPHPGQVFISAARSSLGRKANSAGHAGRGRFRGRGRARTATRGRLTAGGCDATSNVPADAVRLGDRRRHHVHGCGRLAGRARRGRRTRGAPRHRADGDRGGGRRAALRQRRPSAAGSPTPTAPPASSSGGSATRSRSSSPARRTRPIGWSRCSPGGSTTPSSRRSARPRRSVAVTHPANWTEFQRHLLSTALRAGRRAVGRADPRAAGRGDRLRQRRPPRARPARARLRPRRWHVRRRDPAARRRRGSPASASRPASSASAGSTSTRPSSSTSSATSRRR